MGNFSFANSALLIAPNGYGRKSGHEYQHFQLTAEEPDIGLDLFSYTLCSAFRLGMRIRNNSVDCKISSQPHKHSWNDAIALVRVLTTEAHTWPPRDTFVVYQEYSISSLVISATLP